MKKVSKHIFDERHNFHGEKEKTASLHTATNFQDLRAQKLYKAHFKIFITKTITFQYPKFLKILKTIGRNANLVMQEGLKNWEQICTHKKNRAKTKKMGALKTKRRPKKSRQKKTPIKKKRDQKSCFTQVSIVKKTTPEY